MTTKPPAPARAGRNVAVAVESGAVIPPGNSGSSTATATPDMFGVLMITTPIER